MTSISGSFVTTQPCLPLCGRVRNTRGAGVPTRYLQLGRTFVAALLCAAACCNWSLAAEPAVNADSYAPLLNDPANSQTIRIAQAAQPQGTAPVQGAQPGQSTIPLPSSQPTTASPAQGAQPGQSTIPGPTSTAPGTVPGPTAPAP